MKIIKKILFALILNFTLSIYSKVLIFTFSYNRPDFIEIQYKTLKKFLKDDYEFVVFNDAPDLSENEKSITNMCKKLNIKHIRIPQNIHSKPYLKRWPGEDYNHPTIRCCNVIQYSLNTYGFNHDDIVLLLDSDIFLIREFSIQEFLKNYDIVSFPQQKANNNFIITQLSVHLTFLNMPFLHNRNNMDFNCGKVFDVPVDAGGQTYFYLRNNPDLRIYYLNNQNIKEFYCENCFNLNKNLCNHNTVLLKQLNFSENEINFIQSGPENIDFLFNKRFLHYRSGSNWNNQSEEYHRKKTNLLNNFINNILT